MTSQLRLPTTFVVTLLLDGKTFKFNIFVQGQFLFLF